MVVCDFLDEKMGFLLTGHFDRTLLGVSCQEKVVYLIDKVTQHFPRALYFVAQVPEMFFHADPHSSAPVLLRWATSTTTPG